ncbi:MAG TPA: hypothetical protein VHA74_01445 [Candidatus Dojkabacteria bacterium]|nr:hypothetical protein [Candidatus Dojkabacteria bacterium]
MKGKTKKVDAPAQAETSKSIWSSILPQNGEGCFTSSIKILIFILLLGVAIKAYPAVIAFGLVYLIHKKIEIKSKLVKFLLFGFIILTGMTFASYTLSAQLSTDTETTTSNSSTQTYKPTTADPKPEETEKPVEEVKPDPKPISLSGSGDSVTKKLKLIDGYALLKIKHTGKSNFALYSHSTGDDRNELLVNEIGIYSGTRFIKVNEGEKYFFEVNADGNWSITITQPTSTSITAPTTLKGKGDQVQLINMEKGSHTLKLTHTGTSNFVVYFVDPYSYFIGMDLVVNEIGKYNGTNLIKSSDDGLFYIVIEADGNWTAKIE